MQNHPNCNKASARSSVWTPSTLLLVALTLLPAVVYMAVIWSTTDNTPRGDENILSIFTIVHNLDSISFREKLDNFLWTYYQHRTLMIKASVLVMYWLTDHINLHLIGFFGNFTLCIIVYMTSRNIIQRCLPMYGMVVASLMILSLYPWIVAVWPICALGYYITIMLAFACFYFLDLTSTKVFLAAICGWLSTFTMSNGLLSIVIGSLIVIYNQKNENRYSSRQLLLWTISAIGCLAVHFSTMNIFSTEIYGAKTVQESFANLSGRMVDFLESMGAAPFLPRENREGKIFLGCIFIALMVTLAFSKKSLKSPAIVGLALFSTGTLFLTSIFRYSAGDNEGYQIFTAINMSAVFIIAAEHIRQAKNGFLPALILIAALLFNLNALITNTDKMLLHRDNLTNNLEKFLLTGNPDTNLWSDAIMRDGITRDIYRPLQSHQTLKIPSHVETLNQCPAHDALTAGDIASTSTDISFALKISAKIPIQPMKQDMALVLCGEKNYRLTLSKNNIHSKNNSHIEIDLLIDKRKYENNSYRAYVQNGSGFIALPEPLYIPAVIPRDVYKSDCVAIKRYFAYTKSLKPIIAHYCQKVDWSK